MVCGLVLCFGSVEVLIGVWNFGIWIIYLIYKSCEIEYCMFVGLNVFVVSSISISSFLKGLSWLL